MLGIHPHEMTDQQLAAACAAARKRAERLLRASRRSRSGAASEIAQASNRAVSEYLELDAERRAREHRRLDPIATEGLDPQADPMPAWLVALVLVAVVVIAGALAVASGAA